MTQKPRNGRSKCRKKSLVFPVKQPTKITSHLTTFLECNCQWSEQEKWWSDNEWVRCRQLKTFCRLWCIVRIYSYLALCNRGIYTVCSSWYYSFVKYAICQTQLRVALVFMTAVFVTKHVRINQVRPAVTM